MLIYFVPLTIYSLFLLLVSFHMYWLKRGKGSYHKKQLEDFQNLFEQGGAVILLNPKILLKTAQVAFSQQKMFFNLYNLKGESEYHLESFMAYKARLSTKEALGLTLTPKDLENRESIENAILDRQAALWEINEQLGYKSKYVEGLSENRISELKSYLKDI